MGGGETWVEPKRFCLLLLFKKGRGLQGGDPQQQRGMKYLH